MLVMWEVLQIFEPIKCKIEGQVGNIADIHLEDFVYISELNGEFITQAACGEYFSIFMNRENNVLFSGRLGDYFGSSVKSTHIQKINGLKNIKSISAGNHTAFFLTSE